MFICTSNLRKREIAHGMNITVAWGERLMMSFVELAPHTVIPRHSHPHEQMGMVLEGEFELSIGDESRLVQEGDVYLVPSGVEHSARVLECQSRALDIFSPPREDYK